MRIPILFLSLLMGKSLYTMESQSISIVGETSVANLQITFIEGVKVNDIETVTNLLTQGINPFLRDSEGLSALDHAARLGAAGAEMRKLLLEHCSRLHVIVPERVNSANNGCFSTPYITHNRALLDAFSTENTKKFKSLLKSPLADIHCKSSYEGDPLWLELRRRYNEERRNLPQQEDERPHTLFKKLATILPSLCAKQQTHLRKLYTILIAHEAQLRTNKKLTPLDDLIRALIEENNEEVRILAVSVHDINQLDPNCHSALGIALLYNPSCVSLLCANSKLNPNIPSKAKIGLSNFNRLIYSLEQALDLFAMSTEISNEDAVADFFSGYEPLTYLDDRIAIIRILAEKGASIPAERVPRSHGDMHTLLTLALGVEVPTSARKMHNERWSFTSNKLLTKDQCESLMMCYFWAVDGADFTDTIASAGAADDFHKLILKKFEAQTFEIPLFKDFIKEQLRAAWKKDPQGMNLRDSHGMTPLMWAAARGNLELAEFLVEFATLDLAALDGFFGFNALHFAIRNGHTHLAHFLLALPGIHRIQQTKSGLSPYELAKRCKRDDITHLLDVRRLMRMHLWIFFKKRLNIPKDLCRLIFKLF